MEVKSSFPPKCAMSMREGALAESRADYLQGRLVFRCWGSSPGPPVCEAGTVPPSQPQPWSRGREAVGVKVPAELAFILWPCVQQRERLQTLFWAGTVSLCRTSEVAGSRSSQGAVYQGGDSENGRPLQG